MSKSTTREIIDRIFKEPGIKYELTEFETLGKPIHEILDIQTKTVDTGRDAGKTKYFLKSQVPFSSGKEEVQVYVDGGKSAPEEIIRQLWVYKLIHQYGYQPDEIDLEKSVQFGTEVGTKAADIVVYTNADKETPKIIVECKKPKRKDGIEQLKSYMNAKHQYLSDLPDENIPEEIADLIAESFAEPEPELPDTEPGEREYELEEPEQLMAAEGNPTLEERISEAEEKRDSLKAELIRVKQKLDDLASDAEALQQQHKMEIEAIGQQWEGTKRELQIHLKPIKADHKTAVKKLKDKQKIKQRTYKMEIKALEKAIPEAETAVKLLTNKGKLELILEYPDLIGTLKERWIAAEVAQRLDYPIFMAVSERGGKNNSGDYEYRVDEDGHLVEFPDGHPQEGQLVVDQDLVNYDLTASDLGDAGKIPEEKLGVAEAFVRFAQEQGFDFWEVG